jgi:hypothetical protein
MGDQARAGARLVCANTHQEPMSPVGAAGRRDPNDDYLFRRATSGGGTSPTSRRRRRCSTWRPREWIRTVHPTVAPFEHHYRHPGVTSVPFTGLPTSETALVWLTKNHSANTTAFADTASTVIEAHGAL